jgi:hypothetical protein
VELGLAIEMDASIERLHPVLAKIATKLKAFFESKQYGQDLLHIFIGVILTHPDSSRLHPVRKPSFRKLVKYKSSLTNEKVEMHNVFQYDVKPDYEVYRKLNSLDAGRVLCQLLLDSTAMIEAHRGNFPDFDVQQFTEDLRTCLTRS